MGPGLDLTTAAPLDRRAVILGAAAAAAVIAAPGGAAAKGENDMAADLNFEVLSQVRGAAYFSLRNRMLPMAEDLQAVASAARSDGAWARRATAAILWGWTGNTELYRTVTAEVDAVNPEAETKKVLGLDGLADVFGLKAERVWGVQALPLALEAVMKLDDAAPGWKRNIYLAMLARLPDPISVEPVVELMFRTEDALVRWRCGKTLATLPEEIVAPRLDAMEQRMAGLSDAVAEVLRVHR